MYLARMLTRRSREEVSKILKYGMKSWVEVIAIISGGQTLFSRKTLIDWRLYAPTPSRRL